VSVVGEVARPGWVPLAATIRLMDAISLSGGFSPFANRKRVKVIRRSENGEVEFRFDYDAYVAGKVPGHNIRLQPGDTVVVPD
jgi:polysaccharide export outer membrane protein